MDGVPLTPGKFIVHQPRLKSGLPLRNGLARLVGGDVHAEILYRA
ncbi:hypothetical protein [Escherichia coli]